MQTWDLDSQNMVKSESIILTCFVIFPNLFLRYLYILFRKTIRRLSTFALLDRQYGREPWIYLTERALTVPAPCISESRIKMKINFYEDF